MKKSISTPLIALLASLMIVITSCQMRLPFTGSPSMEQSETQTETTHSTLNVPDFEMLTVPAGMYSMPAVNEEGSLTVQGGFTIGKTEVTYVLWHAVRVWAEDHGYHFANMGNEGSRGTPGHAPADASQQPATNISWRDAVVWCNALSEMTGKEPVYRSENGDVLRDARDENGESLDEAQQTEGSGYRLPTSDEWELAARFVDGDLWTPADHASGARESTENVEATAAVAVCYQNAQGNTSDVGSKEPNALGIYDMSGNVAEWTFTRYYEGTHYRLVRGGSYNDQPGTMQIGQIANNNPSHSFTRIGFRLASDNMFEEDAELFFGGQGVFFSLNAPEFKLIPVDTVPTRLENGKLIVTGIQQTDYSIAETEVTYELWYDVRIEAEHIGYHFQNPGREGSDGIDGASPTSASQQPVTNISWRDAVVWCNALSELMGKEPVYRTRTGLWGRVIRDSRDANGSVVDKAKVSRRAHGNGFRLPTYCEWELAARYMGTRQLSTLDMISGSRFYDYTNEEETDRLAIYLENSNGKTAQVATKRSNVLGAYDMSGNVAEWIYRENWPHPDDDRYELEAFAKGGSFLSDAENVTPRLSIQGRKWAKTNFIGFRIASCNLSGLFGDRSPGIAYEALQVPELPDFFMLGVPPFDYTTNNVAATTHSQHTEGNYWLGETEVTYELWYAVRVWAEENGYVFNKLGREGSDGIDGAEPTQSRQEPVTNISWHDAVLWCNALSEIDGLEPVYRGYGHNPQIYKVYNQFGQAFVPWTYCHYYKETENYYIHYDGYRLPRYVEWELAARYISAQMLLPTDMGLLSGQMQEDGSFYSGTFVAVDGENSDGKTAPVSSKIPNPLGFFDMSGNVAEYTYTYAFFQRPSSNQLAVGGSYWAPPEELPSIQRSGMFMDVHSSYTDTGFRLYIKRAPNHRKGVPRSPDPITDPEPDPEPEPAEAPHSLDMVYIPAGNHEMPTGISNAGTAFVQGGFYLGATEVTFALWEEVRLWAERNGYAFQNQGQKGSQGPFGEWPVSELEPVTMVSWRDAVVWCNALSEMKGMNPIYTDASGAVIRDSRHENGHLVHSVDEAVVSSANGYRLPTSEEWELAARFDDRLFLEGYTPGDYASGARQPYTEIEATREVAVFGGPGMGTPKTETVASKAPNALGIYDMSGNVNEWTFSDYSHGGNDYKIYRGGGWNTAGAEIALGYVHYAGSAQVLPFIGFRIARY